jgi:hypothetical protein
MDSEILRDWLCRVSQWGIFPKSSNFKVGKFSQCDLLKEGVVNLYCLRCCWLMVCVFSEGTGTLGAIDDCISTLTVNPIEVMKKYLLTALMISLAGFAGQAQMDYGPGPGPIEYERPATATPPEEVVALREEIRDIRSALEASRQELLDSLGELPDREAVAEALALWREENMETILQVSALARELRELMQEYRPIVPPTRPVPEEIVVLRQELRELRGELSDSRAALIESLGEDATREEVIIALRNWRQENSDDIEHIRELAMTIATWFRENRPVRHARPGMDSATQQMREDFLEKAQALAAERRALREQLRGATAEERETLLRNFQEQQRLLLQERRELKRAERLGGRVNGGDPRRGG